MRFARVLSAFALVVAAVPAVSLIHCGGGGGVPTVPTSPTESQSAITPAVSATTVLGAASSTASPVGSSSSGGAGSTPSATASASAAPPPPEDPNIACGAVSAPFEQSIRPEIKKCFFDAMKTNPKLTGNVKIVVHVGPKGQIQAVNVVDAKELGTAAVACMTKVVKEAKLDTSPCKDRKIEMPMAFGNAAREKK